MATPVKSGAAAKAIRVLAPNEDPQAQALKTSVFLAGSIDAGAAPDWQADITRTLSHLPIALYNPRRPDWDWANQDQQALIKQQIDWEHKHLTDCDIIAMFLVGTSKSPITLLELGLFASSEKLVVGCEEEFYRRNNVKWVCDHYKITLVSTQDELAKEVERRVVELESKRR